MLVSLPDGYKLNVEELGSGFPLIDRAILDFARPDARRYLLVALCFTLGLMSKPMVVTLPAVLLLLDY